MGAEISILSMIGGLLQSQMGISNNAKARKRTARVRSAQIEADRVERDRLRQAEQRKRIGQLRSRLGASGVGSAGGSAAAVQAGLKRSDADRANFEFDGASRDRQIISIEQDRAKTSDLLQRADSFQSTAVKAAGFFKEK